MPKVIGDVDDDLHQKLNTWMVERLQFFESQLQPEWAKMTRYWKHYLGDRPDTRGPTEKWRARTHVPVAFWDSEAWTAQVGDLMSSADPPIQAEGSDTEDEPFARKITGWQRYILAKNKWDVALDIFLRELGIQGTQIWKPIYVRKERDVIINTPTVEELAAYDKQIEALVQQGAPDPAQFPGGFDVWREVMNASKQYEPLGEPPKAGVQQIIEYRGPWFDRPSMYDMRYDPLVETIEDQECVMQRFMKPNSWILQRAGAKGRFDKKQVDRALMGNGLPDRLLQWEREVAEAQGIPFTATTEDPYYAESSEAFEIYAPKGLYCIDERLKDVKHLIWLNRHAFINKEPDHHPYWHGMAPYVKVANIPLGRRFHGISNLQQPSRLFVEIDTLRDLRIDAVTLAVLPLFQKLKDMGLPDAQHFLKPGKILDVSRADGLKAVTGWGGTGLAEVFREIEALKADVDESFATGPNVRGQTSQVGRVSATESQARLGQSVLRMKRSVLRIEAEHTDLVRQSLFMCYQFWPQQMKLRVGGDTNQKDPFVTIDKKDFLEALDRDYTFRGASKALNKELAASQLQQFLTVAAGLNAMTLPEIRSLLKRIYETLGHKGVETIITEEGTQQLVAAQQQAAAMAQAQAAGAQEQTNLAKVQRKGPVLPQAQAQGNGGA